MEVIYDLERKDLVRAQWYLFWYGAASRRINLIMLFTWVLLSIMFAMASHRATLIARLNVFVEVLLFFLIFSGTLIFIMNSYVYRKAIPKKKHNGLMGRHKLVLTPKGLWEFTKVNESLAYWHGIDRIEENEDYIFIFTTPSSAHIVPKRVFENKESAKNFYEAAAQYYQTAQVTAKLSLTVN